MRYILFSLALMLFFLNSCGTGRQLPQSAEPVNIPAAVVTERKTLDFHDQSTFLLGYFNPAMLRQEPHSTWYIKGYDEYVPSSEAMNNLLDIPRDDLSIKIVMGTWCPDSRREVPRFMKILDTWHFPLDKVTFIGVNEDKISPVGDYDKLNIERVPTFIFYKNNIETGRIIEVPKTSLEQDMVNILKGMNK